MAGKPEWFDGAVGPMLQQVQSQNAGLLQHVQEENRRLVETIREENRTALGAVQSQIKNIKDEQDVQKGQTLHLQEEVKHIRTIQAQRSLPSQLVQPSQQDRKEITVTGFCEYRDMGTIGWTREQFQPLLKRLIEELPEELQGSVVQNIKVIGYRNLKFAVDVEGNYEREIQQRWQEWINQATTHEIADHMTDEVQIAIDTEKIKVYCQRSPEREAKEKFYGRLKAVANYEFDTATSTGYPEYAIGVTWNNQLEPTLFAKLDRYSENVIFGQDALTYLGWTEEEANRRVRSFHL